MNIAEVIARAEIQDVLYHYARGLDRSDLDLLTSVYHREAIDHHGPFVGSGSAFAQRLVERDSELEIVGEHHITNMNFKIRGDDAWVESYFLFFDPHNDGEDDVPIDSGTAQRFLGVGGGRYLDHFQQRPECGWRILHREVIIEWSRRDFHGDTWSRASADEGGFIRGQRAGDRSYELFAEADGGCKFADRLLDENPSTGLQS